MVFFVLWKNSGTLNIFTNEKLVGVERDMLTYTQTVV